jgi:lactate racemase
VPAVKIRLDYGTSGLEVDLPDTTTVVESQLSPPMPDPQRAVRRAIEVPDLGPPLRDLVSPGDRVAISVCDGTRPQPRRLVLEPLLHELRQLRAADDVTVLIATGTHQGNSHEELLAMLGEEVMRTCEVINHDSQDANQLVHVGTVAGDVPVILNRRWTDADVRITTGFVEPHFFAGFSGGPKMVAPGLAALETVMALHNARRIGHPKATWGQLEGNPVHDAIRAAAATCPPHLAIDVLLNPEKKVTHVFSGDLERMHAHACQVARAVAMAKVPRRFQLVVTTNSGYPLDQNLYQAVKGMSAAAEIVTQGGIIVCAAECAAGLPPNSVYAELLASGDSIHEIDQRIVAAETVIPDQWQVQVQARVQRRARVLVRADGLSDQDLAAAHLEAVDDVSAFVKSQVQRDPELSVAVLPSGPQTIAYVA